ncbi:hypothetical protein PU629_11200 [Pullulanibacillus sp. KACC 23026]|uniref:hypothetical protein n=1 Tax=Pullulanibacillus sp. KACC 23026 TaxID=3028315 RepID=UPI0023B0FA9D|nr:hypothetical protein [Pullulanibacillus sp. KACC 23026]WEG10754.1 hypothetical protein PU629_11200 [Pullulanibacillus sp. KACC 23026]
MTADMGGLDVFHAISEYLFSDLSIENHSLQAMVKLIKEKNEGIKNGKGFYDWPEELAQRMREEREQTLIDFLKKDDRSS